MLKTALLRPPYPCHPERCLSQGTFLVCKHPQRALGKEPAFAGAGLSPAVLAAAAALLVDLF